MKTREDLINLIRTLGTAPSGGRTLDDNYTQLCREVADDPDLDPVAFLRDLRDMCVHAGASSGFIIIVISKVLDKDHPETDADKEHRRDTLLERWVCPVTPAPYVKGYSHA